jgi:drug/metabolite transporter (DMT)-like permease
LTGNERLSLKSSYGYVLMASLGLSFILVFSTWLRNTGMSSLEQLFFRVTIAFAVLSIILLGKRSLHLTKRKDTSFFATTGLTYAAFTFCGLSALAFHVPIAVTVALIYTQPIYTALISHFKKKEKITMTRGLVVLIGILGVFLVSGIDVINPNINVGIIFPISAGVFYAFYLLSKRRANELAYTPPQVLFNTFLFAIPSILVFSTIFIVGVSLTWVTVEPLFIGLTVPNPTQLIMLAFFAVFSTLLPYGALNYVKTAEVSPTTEAITSQIDPLLRMIWAMIFFHQYVSLIQYFGAFLILSSSSLVLIAKSVSPNKKQ